MKIGILIISLLLFQLSTGQGFAASFADNGDGTVTDSVTGLMWQQGDDGVTRMWQDALSYCESLSLAGHTDWRLPDINELRSIVDHAKYSPAIDTTFFPNAHSSDYWAATTYANNTSYAWVVLLNDGYVNNNLKSFTSYMRCVRGGQ